MKKELNRQSAVKIRYPIGFKLVVIITALILFSLSLITALVSVMVSSDVRITAEDNNLSVNSRSAAEAERALNTTRSNALVLLELLAAVFFSPESLSETFETGANSSFMINGEGDLLVHPEHDLVRAGGNVENQEFIRAMRENSGESMQSLYTGEDDRRYFGAFTKLSLAGAAVITTIEYDVVFEGIAATTRRNIYLTIAVLLAAVILIRLFSKTISTPLKVLTGAAEQIEEGQREGVYYWTIQAETIDGLDISARSPRRLRVLPVPPLPAAENRRPEDGARITAADLTQSRRIVFSWDPVPGATGYLFALEREPGTVLIQAGPFAETRFVLEGLSLLDVGGFIWRLEAVMTEPARERREDTGEIFQRGETAENRFTLDFVRPYVPNLQHPGALYGRE